ncbi:ribokinase-like isoform X2 [Xenia sp. Carnegie-2017]|uniref:ribokinase-like isoform X2 n=1 Tax=Xenia sp. Carnegie-2017 TaxID=2897299 RepID=UPI001F04991B|nr:ribokinase-like isoform X2 [Xenia sp. Carnegie-2017]
MNVRMDIFTTKKNCSMDIVVVGACFCDLQTYVDSYPTPGETILGRKFQMDFGGKGANTCVMAAKLGAKTSMVSVVGDDVLGKETLANFVKFGVNTECLGTATEVATAMTNCIVDNQGEPSYISIPGASKYVSLTHIHNAKHVIEQSKVLVTNNGIPSSTALEALKLGKKCGCITVYNPSPMIYELPDELWENVDVLILNMKEASVLTGLEVTSNFGCKEACHWFHNRGIFCVILTMGDCGANISFNDLGNCNIGKNDFCHVPAPTVHVVDSTGAGDSLTGAFAFYISCYPHLPLREVVSRSVAIATKTVEMEGVQKSYPPRESLPQYLFD